MNNKLLIWIIIVIFILIIFSIVFLSVYKKPAEEPDSASVQCAFFCETAQKTGFCSFEINADENLRITCNELSQNSQYSKYGVQSCSSISCESTQSEPDKTCVTGLNSTWVAPTSSGECPIQENKLSRKRAPSDAPPIENQICCFYYEDLDITT